jgi:putative AdoMet-dependent methyltransferase
MLERARLRLAARAAPCDFVVEDLLGYFEEARGPFAAVASTYAIHHLEQGEKHILFAAVRQSLLPGGCAVFGDLMFADRSAEKEFKEECLRTGRRSLVEDIEDEYFWRIDEEIAVLRKLGFSVEKHRVSQLSWIVRADLA